MKKKIVLSLLCALLCTTFVHSASAQVNRRLPAGIHLVWETDTYTPPFYKGKALYAAGASMRIVAFPEEQFGDPDELFYEWSIDGRVLGQQSGKGARVFILEGSSLVPTPLISVSAREAPGGDVIAAAGMRPTVVDPLIVLYSMSPTSGTSFQNEVQDQIEMSSEELTLSAYPYFFSTASRRNLKYEWLLNGRAVGNSPLLTLKKGGGPGTSGLLLNVTHPSKLLQQDSRSSVIIF